MSAVEHEQLALPLESAEAEFREWLESQPEPDWMQAVGRPGGGASDG